MKNDFMEQHSCLQVSFLLTSEVGFYQKAAFRAPLINMSHFVTLLEDRVEEGVNLKHLKARDNAQLTN